MMDFKLKAPMRAFWSLAAPFVKAWMGFLMRPIIVNRLPEGLKPPYLIISNHVTVYDGLIVALYSKHLPVVVFDDVQRLDFLKTLLFENSGVIFKPVGIPDPLVVRHMVKARDAGRNILLYPEGEITWTGDSKPLEHNLARLVKLLRMPVVLAKFKGGYAKQPNWANSARKGRCQLEYDLLLTPEQLDVMDDTQILQHLSSAHRHSEIDWLASEQGEAFRYSSSMPTLGLQLLLFCCPSCKGTNCMKTDASSIHCEKCGYSATLDANLRLAVAPDKKPAIDDIRQWYGWQLGYWKETIRRRSTQGGTILRADSNDILSSPIEGHRLARTGHGPVVLDNGGIHFSDTDGNVMTIQIEEIRAVHSVKFSANRDYRLLIRTSADFFLIPLVEPNLPVLSWELAIEEMIAMAEEMKGAGKAAPTP